MQPTQLKFIKIISIAVKAKKKKIIFPNYTSSLTQKLRFRSPCLKPLLVTILSSSMPLLSEGQAGEAWEPSNKDAPSPSPQ
jgi:hypothetical protein